MKMRIWKERLKKGSRTAKNKGILDASVAKRRVTNQKIVKEILT
jgi:hypothetical protein